MSVQLARGSITVNQDCKNKKENIQLSVCNNKASFHPFLIDKPELCHYQKTKLVR